jgi:hypothetical protein
LLHRCLRLNLASTPIEEDRGKLADDLAMLFDAHLRAVVGERTLSTEG